MASRLLAADRVIAAHHLGGCVAHFPAITWCHLGLGQEIAESERVAHALHHLELGPGERSSRAEDDDGPSAIAPLRHQESHLGPKHGGRRANLAVDCRGGLDDVPHDRE